MNRGYFSPPVTVALLIDRVGVYRNVLSAEEAARLLVGYWPKKGRAKRFAAMRACLEVGEGRADAKVARAAFIAAVHEAEIYVKD
ncbi:hypothetical protein ATN84_22415 [Paramesorhizobium deserti]|uniref:DUF982 domain-containing protein n=1 Tax=Paramesorhizobium deserti TaxID=1494590 RepID=A0A135HP30_9HYPH|nr:DUF982 domain-containing protein [Paramesorhizobium deserti]KXF74967.1 hypothetical protein ATN84_22415 [Paramesorhizobium deserti]